MENLRKPYDEKIYWRMSGEWFATVREVNKLLSRLPDNAPQEYPIGSRYFDSLFKHISNKKNFATEIPYILEKQIDGEVKKIKFYLTR